MTIYKSDTFPAGLCTNKNCSYRHVNVNPKASTCEGFLKGYCADGNEVLSYYIKPSLLLFFFFILISFIS